MDRGEQVTATAPEAPVADEAARKPRRAPRADATDKPKGRAVKAKSDAQPEAGNDAAPEAKAPAKRVRKAGTTDAAAN